MNKRLMLIIILIICIGLTIYFALKNSDEEKNKLGNDPVKNTENVIKKVLSKETKEEELKEITGDEQVKFNIILGEDSMLRNKPSNKLIEKYNLTSYVSVQDSVSTQLEDTFLQNIDYKIVSSEKNESDEVVQTIEVVGFYYELFMADHSLLSSLLFEKGTGKTIVNEKDEKDGIEFYKASVVALKMMEPYINDYENYGEKVTFNIIYVDGKPKNSDQMLTLLLNLRGMNYPNMNFSVPEMKKAQEERVKKYLDTAISNGIYDENDPLKLKYNS